MSADLGEELDLNIPLHEMIQSLRQELTASLEAARGAALRFDVQEIELELRVAVTREAKAGGGIKFWALNAKASASRSNAQTHMFRLKLKPVHSGIPLHIADERAESNKDLR